MEENNDPGVASSKVFNFNGGHEIRINYCVSKYNNYKNVRSLAYNGSTNRGNFLAIGIIGKYKYEYVICKNQISRINVNENFCQ